MVAMRQIFLDTETTGLSADQGDRIIEIGCIEFVNRRDSGRRLHHYINPLRSSHPDALRVHGITDEFLADKPLFEKIADELQEFVAGAEVVIHNASFDMGFLNAEFKRMGRGGFSQHLARVTDSLTMAREMFPGKSNSLDALCKRLEVDNSHRDLHGALLDAGLLAEVYLRLTRGQRALVIDASEGPRTQAAAPRLDLRSFMLPVLAASGDEVAAHADLLADIDKECGGKAIWRPAVGAPQSQT
jgi:DNA polymerase-3 subunit epsilon